MKALYQSHNRSKIRKISSCIVKFLTSSEMYKEKHSKRLVRWTYSQANCIIQANCYSRQIDIETTQAAALVLLHFNDHDRFQNTQELFDSALITLTNIKHPLLLKHKTKSPLQSGKPHITSFTNPLTNNSDSYKQSSETEYSINPNWHLPALNKSKFNV